MFVIKSFLSLLSQDNVSLLTTAVNIIYYYYLHYFYLYFYNINLISNLKQNLIENFYQQNKCFNSNTCYVCKRIDDFTKKKIKRLKRVKYTIKHKGCQKTARIKKMLKNARFSHFIKLFFFFFYITN